MFNAHYLAADCLPLFVLKHVPPEFGFVLAGGLEIVDSTFPVHILCTGRISVMCDSSIIEDSKSLFCPGEIVFFQKCVETCAAKTSYFTGLLDTAVGLGKNLPKVDFFSA